MILEFSATIMARYDMRPYTKRFAKTFQCSPSKRLHVFVFI